MNERIENEPEICPYCKSKWWLGLWNVDCPVCRRWHEVKEKFKRIIDLMEQAMKEISEIQNAE